MDLIVAAPYIIIFLFGITTGSFLNVCIYRIPEGESIVKTPSHCMSCGERLRWYELIPLFSWLFQRGRCRRCHSPISVQYPLIEAANGILWVIVYHCFGMSVLTVICCAVTSALLALSVTDGRTGEIPPGYNWFLLVCAAAVVAVDRGSWLGHVTGALAVSVPLLIILLASRGRAIGGGDVKLMAACGLLLGWKLIILAFILGCIFGSVIHLLRMKFSRAEHVLALGPYLSAGVFVSMLWGEHLLAAYLRYLGL